MPHPVIRLFDGYAHTSPDLTDDVRVLQRLLINRGYPVGQDGLFGRGTESAVRRFQAEHALHDDGVVGERTWAALAGEAPPAAYAKDDKGLLPQLAEAGKYRGAVTAAAGALRLSPALIAGIGSRESGWGLMLTPKGPAGTGDFTRRAAKPPLRIGPLPPEGGFGRGLMQIDYDAHEFAQGAEWTDPEKNIRYGCKVLAQNVSFFERKSSLTGEALVRAAVAAYNCGAGNVLRAVNDNRDVDFYTAGRNYSKDTLDRTAFFRLHDWA